MKFEDLGLHEKILEALSYMGFKEATPIQEQAIPLILGGKDVIACAQTGTGKTAAFMLPVLDILSKLDKEEEHVNTLIIVPTRELAIQIDQQIQGFAYFIPVSSLPVYGGGDGMGFVEQKRALIKGTNIIVATPGKLISHLNLGYANFEHLKFLILDEADRMMDMGFYDDIQKIISNLPEDRQSLMFSATMPPKIKKLVKQNLKDPAEITIAISKPAEGVLQAAYLTYDKQKTPLICGLIKDKPDYKSIIIFSSTKKNVNEIVKSLRRNKIEAEGISSDLDQSEREEVLIRFRSKRTRILVATDVMSRGIDIKDINLVINYDVPGDAEDYVHRVGRTARASSTGVALTLVNEDDMYKFQRIERLIEKEVMKAPLPPELGEGPKWAPKPEHKGRKGGRGGRGGHGGRGGKGGRGGGRKPNNKRRN